MTLFLIAVAALAIVGAVAWLLRPRVTPPPPSERVEECDVCGERVPISEAHVLADVEHDPETGGGTAVVATFCGEHCPDRSRPHTHERTSA